MTRERDLLSEPSLPYDIRLAIYFTAGQVTMLRIVLLTVFVKTSRQERREIRRARLAMERCIAGKHTAEDDND